MRPWIVFFVDKATRRCSNSRTKKIHGTTDAGSSWATSTHVGLLASEGAPMAKPPKSEMAAHTAALTAHTKALNNHAKALAAMAPAASAPAAFPPAGTRVWTNPNCVERQREIWLADGKGGYVK